MDQDPTRIVFPLSLSRDVRKIKRDLYDTDTGLLADVRYIKRRQDAVFWVALGTFGTVLVGVASLVMHAFGA